MAKKIDVRDGFTIITEGSSPPTTKETKEVARVLTEWAELHSPKTVKNWTKRDGERVRLIQNIANKLHRDWTNKRKELVIKKRKKLTVAQNKQLLDDQLCNYPKSDPIYKLGEAAAMLKGAAQIFDNRNAWGNSRDYKHLEEADAVQIMRLKFENAILEGSLSLSESYPEGDEYKRLRASDENRRAGKTEIDRQKQERNQFLREYASKLRKDSPTISDKIIAGMIKESHPEITLADKTIWNIIGGKNKS